MVCSTNVLMILQTEILLTETSDFLRQVIFLKSFDFVLYEDYSRIIIRVLCLIFHLHKSHGFEKKKERKIEERT